jgi:enamine deaminase RidA (YjgF/YER057c/UK114 family)
MRSARETISLVLRIGMCAIPTQAKSLHRVLNALGFSPFICLRKMPQRKNISGGSPFEPRIGFSRAVRVGNAVHVSGTGPVGADQASVEDQTRHVFKIVEQALAEAGATLRNVVRTRMYLTHAADWEAVGKVHGELFGDIRPAATMVVVAALLNPSWRIEIEAEAILDDAES